MKITIRANSDLKIDADSKKLVRVINSALRRTFRGIRQDISKKIRERYTVASSSVTKTLKFRLANLGGEIKSTGTRLPLERFKIKPKRRLRRPPKSGIFAEVIKGQGGYLRRGFIKGAGVWERVGKARFPIKKIYGPSAPGTLNSIPVSNFILQKLDERFNKNLDHEIRAIRFF